PILSDPPRAPRLSHNRAPTPLFLRRVVRSSTPLTIGDPRHFPTRSTHPHRVLSDATTPHRMHSGGALVGRAVCFPTSSASRPGAAPRQVAAPTALFDVDGEAADAGVVAVLVVGGGVAGAELTVIIVSVAADGAGGIDVHEVIVAAGDVDDIGDAAQFT